MKKDIQMKAKAFLPDLQAIAKAMYEHPELGMEEIESSKMIRDWLSVQGFTLEENFHGLPTAFRAVYGKGAPVLGFLCEYDALPELGHSCGHNLIGVISAGAAASLKHIADKQGGTLVVYGTPDEELTCTKAKLTDEGAFDEADAALMLHPYRHNCGRIRSSGNYPVQFEFFGRKCHATEAGPGSTCINALDAAVLAYSGINQIKQYLDANIYGIIDNGGVIPNTIPDYASLRYFIRSEEEWKIQLAVDRVTRCAQAAADSLGAELRVNQYLCPIKPLLLNGPLLTAFESNLTELNEPVIEDMGCQISTDAGNVSFRVPTLHGMLGVRGCEFLDLHTSEFADQTVMEGGRNAIYTGIRVLAGIGCDLLAQPELLLRVKDDFAEHARSQQEKGR